MSYLLTYLAGLLTFVGIWAYVNRAEISAWIKSKLP